MMMWSDFNCWLGITCIQKHAHVANALFHVCVWGLCLWVTPCLYGVTSDIRGCHGCAWDCVWPAWHWTTSRVWVGLSGWPPRWWRI